MRWKTLSPEERKGRLLCTDRLIVRYSSYLAILLAFGVLFPPLALIAAVSIYSITYFEQYAISRLLVESQSLGYQWYQERIMKECKHIAEAWFDTLKIIIPFASFSYAFVVFDTLGDKYGWKVAVGPSLFIFVLPWLLFMLKTLSGCILTQSSISPDESRSGKEKYLEKDLFVILQEKLQKVCLLQVSKKVEQNSENDIEDRPTLELKTTSSHYGSEYIIS
jgi:hypothetical protein